MKNTKIYAVIGLLAILITSCGMKPDNNYRNKAYKINFNNNEITDLGIIRLDSPFVNIPILNLKLNDSSVNIMKIESYKELDSAYFQFKDSLKIDSGFFNNYRILGFGIMTENGNIESYSYLTKQDTLILNCKVRKYPDTQNGYLLPKSYTSCIISLGNKK
jgi:PBP1b-binding outer membrane lipoprotein LpoB